MKKYRDYFIIVIVSILLIFPMFFYYYQDLGHDAKFHISNVLAIKEQISLGRGDSVILGKISNNFGYGTRIFYPPLSQTLTAFISYIIEPFNLDVIVAFKIVHFITILLAGLGMYGCSYKFSKKYNIALFSAVIYMTMPYFLSDIYIRCALGESFIFIFIPIIFSGVISLLENDIKHFYFLFIIGYVGGILSHLVMMMYFTILLFVFLLVYCKKIMKKEVIIHLFISTILVLAIVSPFLEIILSHKTFGNYVVFKNGEMAGNIANRALGFEEYFNLFQGNSYQGIRFNFLMFTIISFVFTIVLVRKEYFPQYSKGFIIFGILAFFLSSDLFPWDMMPYIFRMIQFPWRLVTFVSFSISLIAPLCIGVLDRKIYYTIFFIGILIGGLQNIIFFPYKVIDLSALEYNSGMGHQMEYLPVNTKNNINYFLNRPEDIIEKDNDKISINVIENDVPNMVFEVSNIHDKAIIEMPRLFYLGYSLMNNGKNIELYENSNGFLEAEIQENGKYILTHKFTATQSIVRTISVLTCIGLTIIYIFKLKRS